MAGESGALPLEGGASSPLETMSKSEFAAYRGVKPSAVSHWIRDGKISGAALAGTGRYARINVAVAVVQLGRTLDAGQQLAHGKSSLPSAGGPTEQPLVDPNDPLRRKQLASAEREELRLAEDRENRKASRGFYLVTDMAKSAWARALGTLQRDIEAWLPELAVSLAAETGCDRAVMQAALRREWRGFRERRAERARRRADGLPAFVEDPGEDEDEPSNVSEGAERGTSDAA